MLSNLGSMLGRRFERTGSMDDLNRAVSVASDAVDATPHDHPHRAACLNNLGNRLGRRFERTGSLDDLNQQLSSYTASWHCASAPPSARIQSAQKAADILISQQDWEQSHQLLHGAVSLLPTAPQDALRLLELGRGVIASLLMDMRGDITSLQQEHPGLAEKFRLLRDELDLPTYNATSLTSDKLSSWELQIRRRREADKEFNEVIDTIRAQPGFSDFLQQPAAEELKSAADQGPIIVVNITSFRCDAFLIQRGSIQVVELPGITQKDITQQVVKWLWHNIYTILDDNWPHIWWIPTGLLSQLPLHAAGIYKHASKETVLDRVISSYASSIKALLHGRKHGIRKPSQPPLEDSAFVVAMRETPGLGERGRLSFASDEVEMLKQLCPQLQLTPIEPLRQKDDILKHLSKCKLFHFAGHGQSDPNDPSQSCLLLEDWDTNPLTVGEVRDSRLQDNPPFLAYLSACSTGANKAIELADEGIHLISAFQLAGFRHVVGTLWGVSDKHCVDVARILYKTLQEEEMTDMAVSRGLHRAVRALRDGEIKEEMHGRDAKLARPKPAVRGMVDFFWVPYVHFGV
ncbi:CHAT domain-containing protein [Trichoderma austrokoningii]